MNVAQRIINVLDRRGISRNKMQTDLGLSSATVYTWEKRGTTPKAETLQKIAEYLGVSQHYLLTGEESKQVISNSNIVGEISGTAAIGEGNSITIAPVSDMSEDEKELLRIFKKLDRRGRNDLMHLAYQAEDAFEAKK